MGLLSKKNIDRINKFDTPTSFKKKDLALGSVVMFGDKTFGMFVPEKFRTKYLQGIKSDEGDSFICYAYNDIYNYNAKPCHFDLDSFNDDLIYQDALSSEYDIKRVYTEKVDPTHINKEFIDHFIFHIQKWVKNREYIKR